MQVLILGMPRTGTQCTSIQHFKTKMTQIALADAISQLGISPIYHMRDVPKKAHSALWISAMSAKFESNTPWTTPEEYNKMLAGYEVFQ
jgi:Sulfotransferase domain